MISVSLTALPGPLRQVLSRGLEAVARDPEAEPGARVERPFEAVQLDARRQVRAEELGETARREIRRRLSERGLGVSGLLFPLRGRVADEDRLDARIAAVQAAMGLAFDLGGRALILPAGRRPEEGAPEEARTADVLDLLSRHGDRTGVTLTLRLGSDAGRWAAFLDGLDAPLAAQFDPAAAVIAGQPIEASLRAVAPLVTQLRIRDAVAESAHSGREVQVGRGEVDFELLAGLSTELDRPPTLVVDPGEATAANLRAAVQFAKAVFAGP